jgi:YVTN family beta-propeller protein
MHGVPTFREEKPMRARSFQFIFLIFSLAVALPSAVAQVAIATVSAGNSPYSVAVNSATNRIYVANNGDNTVTVIDGATNNTVTVPVGNYPQAVAVNQATNKIYVVNNCGSDPTCNSAGTVTVIDANNNNNTATVTVGYFPYAVAVNSVTNKIYVTNDCGNDVNCGSVGTVTVIDANNNNNTTTVTAGDYPEGVAVNSTTNKIYVVNNCGNDITCASAGTVTVIDANNNNNTATVTTGFYPYFAAIDSVTNKIYVANNCGNDVNCGSLGTVTVIDGTSNNPTTVNTGFFPYGVAVNAGTNKIYVANTCGNDVNCASGGTVTVIDGLSNGTTTVNVGAFPNLLDIASATNEVYVTNYCGNDVSCNSPGTVTVIKPPSNAAVPVALGDGPFAVAVNAATDRIYVANYIDGSVSVIGGDTTLQFVAVPPCRLVDTRTGGGPIQGGTFQTFNLPNLAELGKFCPAFSLASAAAYSLNVAVVPPGPLGYLTIWPAGQQQPTVATLNSVDGRVKANAAIVPAGVSASVSVFVSNTTDVVLDIDGYFAPATQSTLAFYPLTPCRIADTRNPNGPLGGPSLQGGVERDFPVQSNPNCVIPSTALAYSFNFTVVPVGGQPLGYLTVWPTGQTQPVVSTLNDLTGTVVANAAIVPAGTPNGEIAVFPSNPTDLVIDVNGYFAAPGKGGLSLYPVAPCRVLDTRNGNGAFSGTLSPPVDVVDSVCGPPSTALAYVFNATVVPSGPLGYLTLWPDDGSPPPTVATLNAVDGAVTSNMAIVPTNNGSINAYASNLTQLILDISSYFAP